MITLGILKSELPEFLINDTLGSRLPNWIHWVLTDIISYHEWWWNKDVFSFTTVSGQAEYYLNSRVDGKKIIWMGDEDNERKEIKEVKLEDIYRYDSTPTESGDPEVWALKKQAEVQATNSAAGVVTIVSSSAADTANVIVKGKVSGIDRTESITLNGTSSVNGTITFDASSIESVVLSSVAAGVVTATSGETLAEIAPNHFRVQCPLIRIWRVPSSAIVVPYIAYKKPQKPTLDGDVIDIPDEAFKCLLKGVLELGYVNNGDISEARVLRSQYEQDKLELKLQADKHLASHPRKNFKSTKGGLIFTLPRTVNGNAP